MRKTAAICALALIFFSLGGCAQEQGKTEYIGADNAKASALEAAGFSAGQVEFSGTDMSTRNGMDYYEVEFAANGETYQYSIDAITGVVIDSQTPQGSSAAESSAPDGQSPPAVLPTASGAPTAPIAVPLAPAEQNSGSDEAMISEEEARALALAQVPGASAGDIREFETDYDDGRLEYEGKIYFDHMEYEFEIDGYSGAIRTWEAESIYD